MDLETAKLVAFALWVEAYEGATGKSPDDIAERFSFFACAKDIEDLKYGLGEDLVHKLDNYLHVWEKTVEEAPPPTETAPTEVVESPPERKEKIVAPGSPGTFDQETGTIVPKEDKPVGKKKKSRQK